jgi:type II secretory pathway component PulK
MLLALMVIAVTAALTIYIASSTYYQGLLHTNAVQRLKAEYLLKSVINVARVMVASTNSPNAPMPPPNTWGQFIQGAEVPGDFLGVNDPNVSIGLEITGEDSKLSLNVLFNSLSGGGGSTTLSPQTVEWAGYFLNLFRAVGFDTDTSELVLTGPFRGRYFNSAQLVANLIDYMDADSSDYFDTGTPLGVSGIESQLPTGTFPNRFVSDFEELSAVPGFTPNRLRRLAPLVSTSIFTASGMINVNMAPAEVLRALDPALDAQGAAQILSLTREPNGPLTSANISTIGGYFSNGSVISKLMPRSEILRIIGKVQFGPSRYFVRALLDLRNTTPAGPGKPPPPPEVREPEFFG